MTTHLACEKTPSQNRPCSGAVLVVFVERAARNPRIPTVSVQPGGYSRDITLAIGLRVFFLRTLTVEHAGLAWVVTP
jgi:hypothetical protein